MNELDDYFWDDLLEYIEEGKVIPIIGPGLVTVPSDRGEIPLTRQVAEQLAGRLRVRTGDLPEGFDLNDVVDRFIENRGKKEEIYPRMRTLLKDVVFAPSPALLELAQIGRFKLFVSFTFDSLLADAINAARFGGNASTVELAYSPNDIQDLQVGKKNLDNPVVYHLLGKLSASPDFVACEEDLLEFLQAMQTDARRPHRLFDELQESHLLFLGCDYSDWLIRFIIRIARNQPLSLRRDHLEVLVGDTLVNDKSLSLFLKNFSYNTKLVAGSGIAFTAELARRWRMKHPDGPGQIPGAPSANTGQEAHAMAPGAIFLSYASADLDAAIRIKSALEEVGLEIWFDKRQLDAGDDWDLKIRRNVAGCSLFMPIVSHATESRPEGYFRREWAWAADRALGIADEVPFLVPLTVDDTPPYSAKVPERFKRSQFTHLAGGQVSAEFAERIKQLVRDFHRRQKGV
jgi:hypothetical protein